MYKDEIVKTRTITLRDVTMDLTRWARTLMGGGGRDQNEKKDSKDKGSMRKYN